jgi:F1F0 ATPase subunit 2
MTESIALYVVLAFVAGLFLGFFYFGSLWLTVQSLVKVKRPALISVVSFLSEQG